MDEEERYNRKLEAGLYTLQVGISQGIHYFVRHFFLQMEVFMKNILESFISHHP